MMYSKSMTSKIGINPSELLASAGHPEKRDALLIGAFAKDGVGLGPSRLDAIRHFEGSPNRRIEFTACVLSDVLNEMGLSPEEASQHFNTHNLTALVDEKWDDPKTQIAALSHVIDKRHKMTLERRLAEYGFKELTAIQIFRETIPYRGKSMCGGNLYRARSYWRKFQPSENDFLSNLRLPLSIGLNEGLLLGMCFTDGHLDRSTKTTTMKGRQMDVKYGGHPGIYRAVVPNLMRSVHNYNNYSGNTPVFQIESQALTTWLGDDIGLPYDEADGSRAQMRVPFNQLDNRDAKRAFFSALTSRFGRIYKDGYHSFEHQDQLFVRDVSKLCEMIGYAPSETRARLGSRSSETTPIWYFKLRSEDIKRMLHTDLGTVYPHAGLALPSAFGQINISQML